MSRAASQSTRGRAWSTCRTGEAEDAYEDQWTGTISVIDAETRRLVDRRDRKGKWPGGLAVDPLVRSLFVANNANGTVSIVDTDTNDVVERALLR